VLTASPLTVRANSSISMAEKKSPKNAATASFPRRTPYQGTAAKAASAAESLVDVGDGLDVVLSAH
jgi:hypothetical protein